MRRTRTEKPKDKCHVSSCEEPAERSIARKKVKDALDHSLEGEDKRAQLCKTHYREFKKATKEDRKLESLRR